jgi:hypothetical protein
MTVDEFVRARVLPEHRGIVKTLRQLMRQHAPGSTEVLTYGILGFKRERMLAVINPTKNGITSPFHAAPRSRTSTGCSKG